MKTEPKKVLFLSDTDPNIEFNDCFKNNGFIVTHIGKKLGHLPDKPILRQFNYLIIALKGIFLRKHYDVVFFWQQYIGIYYLLFSFLFRFQLKPCFLFYVIYKPPKNIILNKIKLNIFVFLLNQNILKKVFFFSKSDLIYKKINREKKVFIKFASYNNYIEKNFTDCLKTDYIFSGGDSNRDYTSLAEIACHFSKEKFVVACTKRDAVLFKKAANIEVYTDSYGDKFSEHIINSKAVIIPLLNPDVVSGQLVILQALQAGKIVFLSNNNFLWDWIDTSSTKKFIIPYTCYEDLEQFLKKTSKELKKCAQLSREYYLNNFSSISMYQHLINEIHSILQKVSL